MIVPLAHGLWGASYTRSPEACLRLPAIWFAKVVIGIHQYAHGCPAFTKHLSVYALREPLEPLLDDNADFRQARRSGKVADYVEIIPAFDQQNAPIRQCAAISHEITLLRSLARPR